MSQRSKLVAIGVFVVGIAMTVACGRFVSDDTRVVPIPNPTPVNLRILLDHSGRIMENLESFHYLLDHESGTTIINSSLAIDKAEGDVVSPDKISTEFSGSVGGFPVKARLITLGDSSYMTNFLSGKWEIVPPDVSPLRFFDPKNGITSIMSRVDRLRLLADDTETYRISGRLSGEALAPILGDTLKEAVLIVELTLHRESLYLLKVVISGRVTTAEPIGTVRLIVLSRFNQVKTIESPL